MLFTLLVVITLSACGGSRLNFGEPEDTGGGDLTTTTDTGRGFSLGGGTDSGSSAGEAAQFTVPFNEVVTLNWSLPEGYGNCRLVKQLASESQMTLLTNLLPGQQAYSLPALRENIQVGLICRGPDGFDEGDYLTILVDAPVEHLAFITSGTYNGDLGGLSGADGRCELAARLSTIFSEEAKARTWRAILVTVGVNVQERFPFVAEVINANGQIVRPASNPNLLDGGALVNAIQYDENGVLRGDNDSVWVSYRNNIGTIDTNNSCNNWTSSGSGPDGAVGEPNKTTNRWLVADEDRNCNSNRRIYCVSF